MVSSKSPLCKIYFKSNAAIAFERKRHIDSGLLYIIHPFSTFRTYWELWMMLVFFCSLVINPLGISFNFDDKEDFIFMTFFGTVLDLLCMIDVIFTFLSGYCVPTTREVVLNPRKIAKNYLLGYFILDFGSSFPMDLIHYFVPSNSSRLVLKSVNLLSLLKIVRFRTLIIYMGHAADMWEISLLVYLGLQYSVILCLAIHWTACLHYGIPTIKHILNEHVNEKSWIVLHNINGFPLLYQKYVRCLYRACSYLLGVTHGEHKLHTLEDIIVGMVSFILGYILLAVLLVLMLQIVSSMLSAETKYQEIINQVKEYMGYKQLPLAMQTRLISFYEYRFQKSYFRENVITATLSVRLRREINVHCYQRLVQSVSVFKDIPQQILVLIVNSLKPEIYLPNDIIVKAGTHGDCMYFISSGTVTVVTPTGKEVCHLYDGGYFGEVALVMKDQKRIANVIAIEICELYRLDRKSFRTCFANNSEIYKKFEKVAYERRDRSVLLEDLHKKYLMALEHAALWNIETD